MTIYDEPNILVIHLKRFDGILGGKITRHIAFDDVLDLGPFLCPTQRRHRHSSSSGGSSNGGAGAAGPAYGHHDYQQQQQPQQAQKQGFNGGSNWTGWNQQQQQQQGWDHAGGSNSISSGGSSSGSRSNGSSSDGSRSFLSNGAGAAVAEGTAPVCTSPAVYNLHGVLVHQGFSANSGHYYAYVKDGNTVGGMGGSGTGFWHCMNDSQVYRVSWPKVKSESAYILFYVRRTMKCQAPLPEHTESDHPVTAAAAAVRKAGSVAAAAVAGVGPQLGKRPAAAMVGPQLPPGWKGGHGEAAEAPEEEQGAAAAEDGGGGGGSPLKRAKLSEEPPRTTVPAAAAGGGVGNGVAFGPVPKGVSGARLGSINGGPLGSLHAAAGTGLSNLSTIAGRWGVKTDGAASNTTRIGGPNWKAPGKSTLTCSSKDMGLIAAGRGEAVGGGNSMDVDGDHSDAHHQQQQDGVLQQQQRRVEVGRDLVGPQRPPAAVAAAAAAEARAAAAQQRGRGVLKQGWSAKGLTALPSKQQAQAAAAPAARQVLSTVAANGHERQERESRGSGQTAGEAAAAAAAGERADGFGGLQTICLSEADRRKLEAGLREGLVGPNASWKAWLLGVLEQRKMEGWSLEKVMGSSELKGECRVKVPIEIKRFAWTFLAQVLGAGAPGGAGEGHGAQG